MQESLRNDLAHFSFLPTIIVIFFKIIIRIKQDTKIAITTANLHSTQLYYVN